MSKYHWRESPDVAARLVNLTKFDLFFSAGDAQTKEAAVFLVEGKNCNAITGKQSEMLEEDSSISWRHP